MNKIHNCEGWVPTTSPTGIEILRLIENENGPQLEEPNPWRAAKDPHSGRTYFFNTVTNETTWERPADYHPPAPPPQEREAEPGKIIVTFQVPMSWRPGQHCSV